MIYRLFSRLFGCDCCCTTCTITNQNTDCRDCDSGSCGEGESHSCTPSGCPCCQYDLCGCDIRYLNWVKINTCECELENSRALAENGYDEWRLDPVSVSARFLNSSCVPCNFRGKPAFLRCLRSSCGKTYVLLGISCVGNVALELDCTPICNGKKFYTVCRAAYICC